jgi:LAO/AO transport system kinase
MTETSALDLVADVLAGDVHAIARLMSRAEAGTAADRVALAEIYRHTGGAHVVGLTGVPGSGKSTLARSLALALRRRGKTVGIVAVDPSSPYSGGSIMGDRLRMTGLTGDEGVFIRSMATGGQLGGLARATLDTVDILDAAGFDVVVVETVGVGQDEVDIVQAAETVVVVSAPGLGDDIQAIKAGVLEIADIHAVSKCDRDDAGKTLSELTAMQSLGRAAKSGGWKAPVLATSALNEEGIEGLLDAITAHRDYLAASGERQRRRRDNLEMRVLKNAEDIVRRRLLLHRGGKLKELLDRGLDPHAAAAELLAGFRK